VTHARRSGITVLHDPRELTFHLWFPLKETLPDMMASPRTVCGAFAACSRQKPACQHPWLSHQYSPSCSESVFHLTDLNYRGPEGGLLGGT
jgi:hypothetical protein